MTTDTEKRLADHLVSRMRQIATARYNAAARDALATDLPLVLEDFIEWRAADAIDRLTAEIERLTEELRNERQQTKYMSDLRGMVRL